MSARARVRVTLEIEIGGGDWDATAQLGEVYKRSVVEAKEIIENRFRGERLPIEPVRITIIDMTPIAIITEGVKR
jgi:hypothetical protein